MGHLSEYLELTLTWRRLHEPIQQQALLSWMGSLVVRQLLRQDQEMLRNKVSK